MSDKKSTSGTDKLEAAYEKSKSEVAGTLPGTPEHQEARNAKAAAFNELTEAQRQQRRDSDAAVAAAREKAAEAQQKAADALADSDPNGPPTQTEPNFGLGTAPRTPSPANQAFERAGLRDVDDADIKKAEGASRHAKQHGKQNVGSAVETKAAAQPGPAPQSAAH